MDILIADDYATLRKHLRELLSDAFPSVRIAEAADAAEVMVQLASQHFDLLLLDINMPGRSGLEALQDIRASYRDLRVIVISVHPEEQYAVRSLNAGAQAYVNKYNLPEELALTVSAVMNGGQNTAGESLRPLSRAFS